MSAGIYAADEVADGIMLHVVEPDGLTLTSTFTTARGEMVLAVSWEDLATAEANYEAARDSALRRAAEVAPRLEELAVAGDVDVTRLRRLRIGSRELALFTTTGPPTWWWPRVGRVASRGERGIRAGWLRFAFAISWRTPS